MHYYLVASLPALVFGEPPPFSAAELRSKCAGVLRDTELAELDLLLAGRMDTGTSDFCRGWYALDAQMRNTIATVRAGRLGVDARGYLKDHRGYSGVVEKAVTDAFAKPNPLERELTLDRCRWQLADDLALRAAFGLSAVLAYAVKLQIAARWAGLKDEPGRQRVEELVRAKPEG